MRKSERCDYPLKTKSEIAAFCRKHKSVRYDAKSDSLVFVKTFAERKEAEKFVALSLKLAERLWHHPDLLLQWTKVTLTLRTHDSNGITKKDFEYFEALEKRLRTRK